MLTIFLFLRLILTLFVSFIKYLKPDGEKKLRLPEFTRILN